MSAVIPWTVLLALAAVIARYLRNESTTRRKTEGQQQAVLGEVLEELTSLRTALVAAGTIERDARLPPPSPTPPASESRKLPVRVVSVTKDDDPAHTRKTREVPAAAALVAATRPEEGPSSTEIRARFHKEADAKDVRDKAKEADPTLGDTLHSAVAPPEARIVEAARPGPVDGDDEATVQAPGALRKPNEEEDERTTGEDMTKVWAAPKDPRKADTRRPSPHRPPRPLQVGDPLAGVPLERPIRSASRTAELGRRPTLLGGMAGAREPTFEEKRSADLIAQGVDPAKAAQQAEEEGFIARKAAPGGARPPTPTPTEPGREKIDTRIERRWAEKMESAHQAGKEVDHCHGERCLQEGKDVALCECHCAPCRRAIVLYLQARREILAEQEWAQP